MNLQTEISDIKTLIQNLTETFAEEKTKQIKASKKYLKV